VLGWLPLSAVALFAAMPNPEAFRERLVKQGAAPEWLIVPFAADAALSAFAAQAVGSAPTPQEKVVRLRTAFEQLKRQGALVLDRDNAPKARLPRLAADLFRDTMARAPERQAGCYELSALFVAAARSVGLEAVGVERESTDAIGQIGHVIAGIRTTPQASMLFVDLQNVGARGGAPLRELSDEEFLAHHLNHLSAAYFLRGELAAALRASDGAVFLAPENPSFLNNRATVLAALGETAIAQAEAAHAVELAPHVALYRYQLGRLFLADARFRDAVPQLAEAVRLAPPYGLARRDLGYALLLVGEQTDGHALLHQTFVDAPQTPDIAWFFALALVSGGREGEALQVVNGALAKAPNDGNLQALALLLGRSVQAPADALSRTRSVLQSIARRDHGERGAAPLGH